MDVKYVNPNTKIGIASNLNHMDFYFFYIVKKMSSKTNLIHYFLTNDDVMYALKT